MPFKFDNFNAFPKTIPDATPTTYGVMTPAQAEQLANLPPSGFETLTQVYNNGTLAVDQTVNIAAAKGGPVIFKAASAAVGSLLRALTSTAGVILDAVDTASSPTVLAAGAFIRNAVSFGSPVMGSQTPNNFMSYTADGVGANYGGAGFTAYNGGGGGGAAILTASDQVVAQANGTGSTDNTFRPRIVDSAALGTVAARWNKVISKIYMGAVGAALTITANTIAPDSAIRHVGAGLLKTITPPFTGFTGSIVLWPDVAFTYDATSNIVVSAGGGTAIVDRPMIATCDGTKWAMSY